LKVKHDELVSIVAFNCHLRRYSVGSVATAFLAFAVLLGWTMVGRCGLTLPKPELNAPIVSVHEIRMS